MAAATICARLRAGLGPRVGCGRGFHSRSSPDWYASTALLAVARKLCLPYTVSIVSGGHSLETTMKVLISGASIAGPALACALGRYAHDVTVVEVAPRLREGGSAV